MGHGYTNANNSPLIAGLYQRGATGAGWTLDRLFGTVLSIVEAVILKLLG